MRGVDRGGAEDGGGGVSRLGFTGNRDVEDTGNGREQVRDEKVVMSMTTISAQRQ